MRDEMYEMDVTEWEDAPEVPKWIEGTPTFGDVDSICRGGCASGAYMPAVTYWKAIETMSESGDEIFDFLDAHLGEIPPPTGDTPLSWGGLACHFVSSAVEVWACLIDIETAERGLFDE